MLRDVPDMLTANAATALLVVIAVTSVRAAVRAVGYESWHLVHLTAYAAVALAIPHQLSTGSDLSAHPMVRIYWLGLYVITAGAVIWWRVASRCLPHAPSRLRGRPGRPMEGPGTWSVWVSGRNLDQLDARAGQFLNWRFLGRACGRSPTRGPSRARPTVTGCG